jgi:hypothetical protein
MANIRSKKAHNPKPIKPRAKDLDNDFESVARRLECDPNLAVFDAKLKKIAKAGQQKKS